MGCIYMRISPSGKYYIGKTMRQEQTRWAEHVYKASYSPQTDCWLLNQAINKYGGENFTVKILEDNINDPFLLREREHYWIKYYDATNNKKGYNRSYSDGYLPQIVEQFDLNDLYELREEFINSIDNEINKIKEKNKQKIKK